MDRPDLRVSQRLETARAWFALGSAADAAAELDQLPPEARARPDALLLLCYIYEQAKRWAELEQIAQGAATRYPDYRLFFDKWAWAKHRQGATVEGLELAQNAAHRFPTSATIAYTTACLNAALNRNPEAHYWLAKALVLADDPSGLMLIAADQPELLTVWREWQTEFEHRRLLALATFPALS